MPYVLIARDKPGALETRKANRDAHLAYANDSGVVLMGGPFLDENGDMCGSMAILDVETLAEAEAWAASDPYARAGLFVGDEIKPWKRGSG